MAAMLAVLISLPILVVTFPQPWFEYRADFGSVRMYSELPFTGDRARLASDVQHRLETLAFYNHASRKRVFLCESDRLYRLFGRCALIPAHVPGFNVSLVNNSFVSLTKIRSRRHRNAGFPPYSAINGDLAHNITHELVHDYVQDTYGFWKGRRLPPWKTEGYAEYSAAKASVEAEDALTLPFRAQMLKQDQGFGDARAREYYAWGLVMEFLERVRGYRFEEVMDDSVAFEPALDDLLAWANGQSDAAGALPAGSDSIE